MDADWVAGGVTTPEVVSPLSGAFAPTELAKVVWAAFWSVRLCGPSSVLLNRIVSPVPLVKTASVWRITGLLKSRLLSPVIEAEIRLGPPWAWRFRPTEYVPGAKIFGAGARFSMSSPPAEASMPWNVRDPPEPPVA